MKLIFLDIDGVLNYRGCTARSATGCLGIDDSKVMLLREIIEKTQAKVILTSTWKTDWFRSAFIDDLPRDGQYLERKLAKHKVFIFDKTVDTEWSKRGKGILDFISQFPGDVEQFVILDDESFDFKIEGIDDKFVKTSFEKGLEKEHVEQAIKILNTELFNDNCI